MTGSSSCAARRGIPAAERPDMRPILAVALILAAAASLAVAAPAFGQAPGKLVCSPETVIRCPEPGKCDTRPASSRDKEELLVLDFAAKKASIRRDGKDTEFGDIGEIREADGKRHFTVKEGPDPIVMVLHADGRLDGELDGGRRRFVARCASAT
jgi:hypothetical protein